MKKTITVVNPSGEQEKLELDQSKVDFYKQETKKIRVTERGLTKFFSNLLKRFTSN